MTVAKLLLVGSRIPSLDLADCDVWVLSQHLKGMKGLKFSVVTTEILLQASAQTFVWLAAKVPLQFEWSMILSFKPDLLAIIRRGILGL